MNVNMHADRDADAEVATSGVRCWQQSYGVSAMEKRVLEAALEGPHRPLLKSFYKLHDAFSMK